MNRWIFLGAVHRPLVALAIVFGNTYHSTQHFSYIMHDNYYSDDGEGVHPDAGSDSEASTVMITALSPVPSTPGPMQIQPLLMHRCVAMTAFDRDISLYSPSEVDEYMDLWLGNLSSVFGLIIAC